MSFSKVAKWLSRFVAGPSIKIISIQTQFTNQIHFMIFSLSWDKRQHLVFKLRRSKTIAAQPSRSMFLIQSGVLYGY